MVWGGDVNLEHMCFLNTMYRALKTSFKQDIIIHKTCILNFAQVLSSFDDLALRLFCNVLADT